MTVIAWDGKVLASDKLGLRFSVSMAITKVRCIVSKTSRSYRLVGAAGPAILTGAIFEWAENDFSEIGMPDFQKDPEGCLSVISIEKDGQVRLYEHVSKPIILEHKFPAIGSGSEVAMGAMHAGATAVEAIEICSKVMANCGMGWDAIDLESRISFSSSKHTSMDPYR